MDDIVCYFKPEFKTGPLKEEPSKIVEEIKSNEGEQNFEPPLPKKSKKEKKGRGLNKVNLINVFPGSFKLSFVSESPSFQRKY